jgi:hypothetical protein
MVSSSDALAEAHEAPSEAQEAGGESDVDDVQHGDLQTADSEPSAKYDPSR